MSNSGTHPLLAAQIARYRADELIREATNARRRAPTGRRRSWRR